jgi:hypothetical protein
MSTYENGPGNVPRLPDRVVDTLIDSAGVSRCAPGLTDSTVRDQTANVEQLVHDSCEELLARLPASDTRDAARYRGLRDALLRHDTGFFERLEAACPALVIDNQLTPTASEWDAALDQVLGLKP